MPGSKEAAEPAEPATVDPKADKDSVDATECKKKPAIEDREAEESDTNRAKEKKAGEETGEAGDDKEKEGASEAEAPIEEPGVRDAFLVLKEAAKEAEDEKAIALEIEKSAEEAPPRPDLTQFA